MLTKNSNALILFVKSPIAGKVKTRLAKSIGNEAALNTYIKLVFHTFNVVQQLKSNYPVSVFLFEANETHNATLFNTEIIDYKHLQIGSDLGERMRNAFDVVLEKDYEKVCIIGSDLPELSAEIVETAFEELTHNDSVIGPTTDGGYYLLGMKAKHHYLFANKPWSTANVFSKTIEDLKTNQLTYSILTQLTDIDYWEDLKKFPEFMRS